MFALGNTDSVYILDLFQKWTAKKNPIFASKQKKYGPPPPSCMFANILCAGWRMEADGFDTPICTHEAHWCGSWCLWIRRCTCDFWKQKGSVVFILVFRINQECAGSDALAIHIAKKIDWWERNWFTYILIYINIEGVKMSILWTLWLVKWRVFGWIFR